MSLASILRAPRYAGSRSIAWWSSSLFGVLAIAALAIGLWMPDRRAVAVATMVYALGAACLWSMWLPGLLLVARDARNLGTPGAVRGNALATCVYALLTVALPTAVVASTGGDIAPAILFPGLGVTGGLAFALLPRWVAMWLGFIPALYIGAHNTLHIGSPFDAGVQRWLWLALAVCASVDILRWNQLLRRSNNDYTGWNSTMLMQLRHNAVSGGGITGSQWSAWRAPAGRKTPVDLRGVAPAQPVKAIEVALGGWYVPQTLAGRMRSFARVLLPALLFIPLIVFMNLGHSLRALWYTLGASAALWIGLGGGVMLALGTANLVQTRWRNHADGALLALLPGLGTGAQANRNVVRAIFSKPAFGLAVLTLCMLAPMPFMRLDIAAFLAAILVEAGFAALGALAVLRILVGRPLGIFVKVGLGLLLIVLVDASAILAFTTQASKWSAGLQLEWWLVLAWLVLGGVATWRALVAWRQLQRRPHPFLGTSM